MKKSSTRMIRAMSTVSASLLVCCSARRGPRDASLRLRAATCARAAEVAAVTAAVASACTAAARSANGPMSDDRDNVLRPPPAMRAGATRSSGPAGSCVSALPGASQQFRQRVTSRQLLAQLAPPPHLAPRSSAGCTSCARATARSSAAKKARAAAPLRIACVARAISWRVLRRLR